ncbi:hypothetical protein HYT01_03995 [Candidatus Giovannonibacteria bacterium]|nr:hypothetical protein [Candidatus Giovannonibacteria bacterium]
MLLIISALLLAGLSSFYLKYCLRFKVGTSNLVVPAAVMAGCLAFSLLLRDFNEALVFLGAATVQFTAYIFVSRLRQRGSFFWHALASLASNGAFYVTMHVFDAGKAYWLLIIPFIAGIIAGRIIGSIWAQYVEEVFKLQADATRDDRLAPGKRLSLISGEPTFWVLTLALITYIFYGAMYFETELKWSLSVVIGLGVLQSLFYALTTRAANRGNNTYIAITGLASGVTFYINAVFLLSMNMPLELFLPYVISTTLGSTLGAFFSMIIEWVWKIAPDRHVKEKNEQLMIASLKYFGFLPRGTLKSPYFYIAILALIWVVANVPILTALHYDVGQLKFPLPIYGSDSWPRVVVMLLVTLIFFLDNTLHTVVSRAGNRNHTGFHISACLPKGLVDFFRMGYITLNSSMPDVLPVAIMASCLGSLLGKKASERIEKWLEARMDIIEEKPKAGQKLEVVR